MRILQVDVRATGEKRLRAVDAAFARGVEQGVNPPRSMSFSRGSEVTLRAQSRTMPARIHLGMAADEELHHFGLALGGRPHQRGLISPSLARIHVRTRPHEQLSRPRRCRCAQPPSARSALRRWGVGVGARLEQQANDRGVPGGGGERHGGGAVVVRKRRHPRRP